LVREAAAAAALAPFRNFSEERTGMIRRLVGAVALVLSLLSQAVAEPGPLTWTSEQGGAPSGATLENFDSLELGGNGRQVTETGIVVRLEGAAAVVRGARSTLYARPFLTGENGRGFGPDGSDQPAGPNDTPYITAASVALDPTSRVILTLPFPATYFGLLWGSVDRHNVLLFYMDDEPVGRITGADIIARPAGIQGPEGTRYINVTSTEPFNRVVMVGGGNAPFEFDNVALARTVISWLGLPGRTGSGR